MKGGVNMADTRDNSMLRPAVSQLTNKNDSPYSLVIGVAKRAREIADSLQPKGEEKEAQVLTEKPVQTAIDEFACGKYIIKPYTKATAPVAVVVEKADEQNAGNVPLVGVVGQPPSA
jgi:DNA-directed RNA polymerase subunit omega